MFYSLKEYIKFWLNASNKHGIHSPFVFSLITKGINKNNITTEYKAVKNYKKALLNDYKTIKVTDFGAGSKVFKTNIRPINKIAKNAGISDKKIKLLLKIGTYFKPKNILEIGTSLGIGTYTLATSSSNAKITTLEGCPETLKTAKIYLSKYTKTPITFIEGDFDKTLKKTLNQTYDLVYFDGNHTKKATISYFKDCLNVAHNDTIFIFDDIYWNKEMTEAWKLIKKHPKVTVAIDFFHFGIVSFRKEQTKENFKIRT
jgi:predicted O-methyltransferase YrrM